MTVRELPHQLRREPFEPFEIVTSSGARYPVRHPELALVTTRGTIYVFQRGRGGGSEEMVEGPDVVSLLHVASLEPLRNTRGRRR